MSFRPCLLRAEGPVLVATPLMLGLRPARLRGSGDSGDGLVSRGDSGDGVVSRGNTCDAMLRCMMYVCNVFLVLINRSSVAGLDFSERRRERRKVRKGQRK